MKGKVLSLKAVQKSKYPSFPLMKTEVWKANYSEPYSNRANEAASGSEDTKPSMIKNHLWTDGAGFPCPHLPSRCTFLSFHSVQQLDLLTITSSHQLTNDTAGNI